MTERLNILLVDDDPTHRQFFRESLDSLKMEYDLFISDDCNELFYLLLNKLIFDIIILDIDIPKENGKDCLKRIKADPKFNTIPVVIFTSSQKHIDEAFESGAHYYAIKPYYKNNYREAVGKIFGKNWKETQTIPSKEDFVINMTF